MRIAIVDDEIKDANKIEFALMGITNNLKIDKFESGNSFLEKVRSGIIYDIVFMDIYLGEENGVDIVRNMQELAPTTQVIFSTMSKDHAIEAFDLNAIGYLVKPYEEANIIKVIAWAGLRRENTDETVLLRFGTEYKLFRVSEVVKLESDNHHTKIYLSNGSFSRYLSTYSEVSEKFVKGFIEIKRGVSINMAYIDRIKNDIVYLKDCSNYKIARGKKDFVVTRFAEYVTKRNSIFG